MCRHIHCIRIHIRFYEERILILEFVFSCCLKTIEGFLKVIELTAQPSTIEQISLVRNASFSVILYSTLFCLK